MTLKRICILLAAGMFSVIMLAQSVNLEQIGSIGKNKAIAFGGGLSAGSVFYAGNQPSGRQPWTWYLNGNLNINLYGQINIPLGLNFTNLGMDMSYPSLPNRLSLHPTYKWITAHIGDVSMNFSPYTLSGHQFTGGGVELSPKNLKISLMGGRMLRKVAYNYALPSLMPNYTRAGYGAKAEYQHAKFTVGMTYFGAQDIQDNAMLPVMDSLGITPMQNSVLSWNLGLNVVKNLNLTAEYTLSFLTKDIRSPQERTDFTDKIIGARTSTDIYNALKLNLNYRLMKNTIGIGYERIDPEYQTLGAYYFNNDYENITLNFARPFLKDDKADIAVSFGVQRDDLDNTKEEKTNRYVGSVNLNYNPTENLQTSLNYSTFQSHKNIKSQFDYINEISPYDNMDTLRFTQLSQNIDGTLTWTFRKSEKRQQRLNFLASYQEAADRQGEVSLPGNVSRFLNSALGYNLTLVPQSINISASMNGSYSYAATLESYTVGPMLNVTASLFKKTMTAGFATAYNVNLDSEAIRAKILTVRANATYRLLKKHNFNFNIVWQNRSLKDKPVTDALTTGVSYSYSF